MKHRTTKANKALGRASHAVFGVEHLETRTLLTANISIDSDVARDLNSVNTDIETFLSTTGNTGLDQLISPTLGANDIPLVGPKLQQALQFLSNLTDVSKLNTTLQNTVNSDFQSGTMIDAGVVQADLYAALNNSQTLLDPMESSKYLVRFFDSGGSDITVGGGQATRVQFNLDFAGNISTPISTPFDLGMPGLSFNVSGSVNFGATYELFLHVGYDKTLGFYLDTNPLDQDASASDIDPAVKNAEQTAGTPPPILHFEADVTLKPGASQTAFQGTGTLGPLQLSLADHTGGDDDFYTYPITHTANTYQNANQSTPTSFKAKVDLTLAPPGSSSTIAVSQLSSITPTVKISGAAIVNLDAQVSLNGNSEFPSFDAEFHIAWNFLNLTLDPSGTNLKTGGSTPDFSITDINLDIGSFLKNTITPIIGSIYTIVSPLRPLVTFLNRPMPIINDLGPLRSLFGSGGTVTVAKFLSTTESDPAIEIYCDVLNEIYSLHDQIEGQSSGALINLGSFDFGGDPRATALSDETVKTANDVENDETEFKNALNAATGSNAGDELTDTNPDGGSDSGGDGSGKADFSFKLDFPLFDDPASAFRLFLDPSNPVDLFTFKASVNASAAFSHSIPILGPLEVDLHGSIDGYNTLAQMVAHLDFGYDTQALTDSSHNPLDGFYIDTSDTNLSLNFSMAADAALDLVIAEAGVGGGISSNVNFTLNGPADSPKLRLTDITDPARLFNVSGGITAFIDAFYRIGIGPFSFGQDFHLASSTLIQFGPPSVNPPDPAFFNPNNPGELDIEIGSAAGDPRLQNYDDVRVDYPQPNSSGGTLVDSVVVTLNGDPTSGQLTKTFDGVTSIHIIGGTEGDEIFVGSDVGEPVTIQSGSAAANTTQITDEGYGDFAIYAGAGNDTISVTGATNGITNFSDGGTINGGAGDDNITVTAYIQRHVIIYGGFGSDNIYVGPLVLNATITGATGGHNIIDSSAYYSNLSSGGEQTADDQFIVHAGVFWPLDSSDQSMVGATYNMSGGIGSTLEVVGAVNSDGTPLVNTLTLAASPINGDPGDVAISDQYTFDNPSTAHQETFQTQGIKVVDVEGNQPSDIYNAGDLTSTDLSSVFIDLNQSSATDTNTRAHTFITAPGTVHTYVFNSSSDSITMNINDNAISGGGNLYELAVGGTTNPLGPLIYAADGNGDQLTFYEPTGSNYIYVNNTAATGPLYLDDTNSISSGSLDSVTILNQVDPIHVNTAGQNTNIIAGTGTATMTATMTSPLIIDDDAQVIANGPLVPHGTVNLTYSNTRNTLSAYDMIQDGGINNYNADEVTWDFLSSLNLLLNPLGETLVDHLTTATFAITIQAQGGNDSVDAHAADAPINFMGSTGTAAITGSGRGDDIVGATGALNVSETNSSTTRPGDTVVGGSANDTILAIGGNENLFGGAGNDTISYVASSSAYTPVIEGGFGSDSIFVYGGTANIYTDTPLPNAGQDGYDTIQGTAAAATIYGGAGHDLYELGYASSTPPNSSTAVNNAFGPTEIFFGPGQSTLFAPPAAETLLGGSGTEILVDVSSAAPARTPMLIQSGTLIDAIAQTYTQPFNYDMNVSGAATLVLTTSVTFGSLSGAGTVQLGSYNLKTGSDNTSSTFSGVISGTGSLTKSGTGTFTLSGTNTYSGGTTITGGGTLSVSSDASLGVATGAVTLTDTSPTKSTLLITSSLTTARNIVVTMDNPSYGEGINATPSAVFTMNGTLSGYGAAMISGGGTVVIGKQLGSLSWIQADNATLKNGITNALGSDFVHLGSGAVYDLDGFNQTLTRLNDSTTVGATITNSAANPVTLTITDNTNYGGNIQGNLSLVTSGYTQLRGVGSFSGTTSIVNSTVLASASALGTTLINLGAASGSASAALVGATPGGVVSNPINVVAGSTGTATLGNYVGFQSPYPNATTVTFTGQITLNRTLTLDAGVAFSVGQAQIFAGQMTGPGGLNIIDSSQVTLTNVSTITPNNWSGATQISGAASLFSGGVNVLSPASAYTLDSTSSLNLSNFNQSIGSISGSGKVALGTAVLTTGNDNSTTYSGVISGVGGVTKVGTGMFILSGADTFSGPLTINAGTVTIGDGTTNGSLTNPLESIVLNVGTIAFNRSDTYTYPGTIAGTGTLIQMGSGTTLMIPPQVTTTLVQNGTLRLLGTKLSYLTNFTKYSNIYTNLNEQFPHTGTGTPGTGIGTPNATFGFDPTPSAVVAAGYAPNYVTTSNLVNNGVPFMLSSDSSGRDFDEIDSGVTLAISANIAHAQKVYALMGAYYVGATVNVTFTAANGATETFNNVPVPNFESGVITSTTPGSTGTDSSGQGAYNCLTVFQVSDRGAGGTGISTTGDNATYDLTELGFTLSPAISSQTLTSVSVKTNSYYSLLLGMTVAQAATSMPSAVKVSIGATFDLNNQNISIGSLIDSGNVLIGSGQLTSGTTTINTGAVLSIPHATGAPTIVQQLGNLTINAGGKIIAATSTPQSNRTLVVASTTGLAGVADNWMSQIDLTNNDMDLTGATLSAVTNQVKEGFNLGTWSGLGVTSSAAANDIAHLTALGVIQNNQGGSALFIAGKPLDTTVPGAADVLIKYTYYGDANLSGTVDGSDYSLIDYGYINKLTGWFNGDFNYDGVIDGSDYTLIDNTYNQQGAPLAAEVAAPTARVSRSHVPAVSLFSTTQIVTQATASGVASDIFGSVDEGLKRRREFTRATIAGII